eukprot:TRINITY_DN8313_c0_g2_i1.p1 TRINITY_DN8313_c0_g2~~TRINITY_DN8313_c0_g2_i1.p1  ORF type:complete len:227 (-),score=50.18 TRINITY_DN8313_c0_g2_i1:89-769(-)
MRRRMMNNFLAHPMSQYPHPRERHIDLQSWMTMISKIMWELAELLGEDAAEFERNYNAFNAEIKHHWNPKTRSYCDIVEETVVIGGGDDNDENAKKETKLVIKHVPHQGYVSLFPVLLQLVEADSDELHHTLRLIRDPTKLWTDYGLRSLSKTDPSYGTGENYWKGPIWINLNYLAVRALQQYGEQGNAQAKQIGEQLRKNVLGNIANVYHRQGFLFEQYGRGERG